MENEADERLGLYVGRYSVVSRNGEWRMENGEWGMGNEAAVRLGLCIGRYSVMSRNGEWRMENEAAAQQFSFLHSPFPILQFVIRKLFPATN